MTVVIDGDNINSLQDFYRELEPFFIEGECPWGYNLDSLDEILMCRFNYTDDPAKDVTRIIWKNSGRSKQILGVKETKKWLEESGIQLNKNLVPKTLFESIIEIFSGSERPELILA